MTRMWEARAAAGRTDELVAWVRAAVAGLRAEVYRSAERVVVLLHDPVGGLPDPPADLVARSPHAWDFERVR